MDIFGRIIYLLVGIFGSTADISCYHRTDVYLQQNGYTFDDDETGGGDSNLRGASNISAALLERAPTRAEILAPHQPMR